MTRRCFVARPPFLPDPLSPCSTFLLLVSARSRGGSGGRPLVACCSSWSRSRLKAAFSAPATMMNPWSFFVLLCSWLIQPRVADALCVRDRLALLVHGPLQKLIEEIFDVAIRFAGVAIYAHFANLTCWGGGRLNRLHVEVDLRAMKVVELPRPRLDLHFRVALPHLDVFGLGHQRHRHRVLRGGFAMGQMNGQTALEMTNQELNKSCYTHPTNVRSQHPHAFLYTSSSPRITHTRLT